VGALFGENILDLRFARPLTHRVSLGVMSTYRSFLRQDYDHSSGGMNGFFSSIYDRLGMDSTYYSHHGCNPLTNEHSVTGRLRYDGSRGARIDFSYQYLDAHNDQSYGYTDSAGVGRLGWEEVTNYRHRLRGRLGSLPVGPVLVRAEGLFGSTVNRTKPLTLGEGEREAVRGAGQRSGVGVGLALPMGTADTLGVSYAFEHEQKERYDGSEWTLVRHAPLLGYDLHWGAASRGFHLGGELGYTFAGIHDSLEQASRWKAESGVLLGGHRLRLFAMQDIMPPSVPYDPNFRVARGTLLDRYRSFGTEARITYGLAGMTFGYTTMYGVADTGGVRGYGRAVSPVWPNGIPPYRQPRHTASFTPFFGPWHGLSLSSRLILADRKPHVKSLSTLSFSRGSEERGHYLDLDLILRYWSRREPLSYGGIDYWHRPIYDLGLQATVQIQTFRLFYRIDNIFNRQIAYVPGYFLPGLVFRWGFNWMIPS
jgi:hypothetical protein